MMRTLRQALIALIATLLALEVLLQLAGAFAGPLLARRSALAGDPDAIRILCVGDSHTYGAPLPEEESYPAQLQAKLEKRYPTRKFAVVNLGVPGVNSAFLAGRLEQQLLQIRPDLLMVSGGLNNRWNDLRAAEAGTRSWDAQRQFLLRVKLFRLLAVATETVSYVPTESGSGRWKHRDHEAVRRELAQLYNERFGSQKAMRLHPSERQIRRTLERDMDYMVRTARGLGIPVIWYSYPTTNERQKFVTDVIAAMGKRLDLPVLPAQDSLSRALADGYTMNDLFVEAAGPHPTRTLYDYITEDMLPIIAAELNLED